MNRKAVPMIAAFSKQVCGVLLLTFALNPVAQGAEDAAVVARLKALVDAGQFAEAYELGAKHQLDLEGRTDFDFYFGTAALESGHYTDAAFALERATIAQPNQPRIRLELARSYFLAGNYALARVEFNEVLAGNPPPIVRNNIQLFLDRMDQIEQGGQRALALYVETATGYDDNINSATANGAVDTPFGTFDLSEDGQSQDDGFLNLGAGLNYTHPTSKDSAFDATVALSHKNNFESNTFDLGTVRVEAGYGQTNEQNRWRVGARSQYVVLDDRGFQSAFGLTGSYARDFGDGWLGSLMAAATTIRFNGDHARDTDQYLGAGSVAKQIGALAHSVSLYGADEPARDDDIGEHNGRVFYGASYALQWQASNEVMPYLILGGQRTEYDSNHPVFAVEREDDQLSGRVGVQWTGWRGFVIRGEYRYTDVDSNIDVFTYDRSEVEAALRYAF